MAYFDQELSWQLEIDEFVNAVSEDRSIEVGTSWDALQVMHLIERIYNDDEHRVNDILSLKRDTL